MFDEWMALNYARRGKRIPRQFLEKYHIVSNARNKSKWSYLPSTSYRGLMKVVDDQYVNQLRAKEKGV